MVGRYEAGKKDPYVAGRLLLAFHGIKEPSIDQEAGALLQAEFQFRVINFLSGKK